MIDFGAKFSTALSYDDFLQSHGSEMDRMKWKLVFDKTKLAESQVDLLGRFKRKIHVFAMAGAWCGDCVRQCPILQRFADQQPLIEYRLIDRDADQQLNQELRICGAARVPQFVFLSEDYEPVGRYGDRTISTYRDMESKLSGAACATGLVGDNDPLFNAVVQDWLTELERTQLILRTSPKLRERHGD